MADVVKNLFKIILGIILVLVPLYVAKMNFFGFGSATLNFVKGGVVILVILIGLMFLFLGFSDIKS